ncbi:sulfatase [Marinilabilia rubra]|uniref:Aryl-sulfate sulfohydrolase n=1 Tax=Marinilabilia rubra TaxID=2162893 RepID=A0A2U2BE86_9BACT|nr:sulfatase [Marinilabilia rubra]PWE01382.1 aryl-sulfate sulfohydrolase [Marinilabilia rubra]
MRKNGFVIWVIAVLIGLSYYSCNYSSGKDLPADSPNVVFIHIDDLGWADLGYMGSDYYETPHIDRLASEGLVFTNAYAGAANCAPSRACLLTGENTPRHGVYTVSPSERGNSKTRKLVPIANTDSILPSNLTLGHLFKKAGYETCAIGKWHVSRDALNNGFDINIAGSHQGNPGKNGYFAPFNVPLDHKVEGEYLTDRLTDEAINFIESNRRSPFFLYMSYYTVHTPLQGKEDLVKKYEMKQGHNGQDNPTYAAMVEAMDQNVGRILNRLEALQLENNTMVVFLSDNGGIRAISNQAPLRGGKGSYYEGGIRVPMIVKWPSNVYQGVTEEPVVNLDFFPTFQSVLNVDLNKETLDGVDLTPLFEGKELKKRPFFWHFPIYLQAYNPSEDQGRDPLFRTRPGSVVRYGNWKLHQYFEDGGLELYNLLQDPGETKNLVQQKPDKTRELKQLLEKWREELDAPVPDKPNPDFDPQFESKRIEKALEKK